ncbi:MAG TPA: hypothetical protein VM939_04595, partial [Gemmatimonadaceae bacterium]|nr:hypothetical protein [Gemmatimonadaceae bacterium]
IVDGQTRPVDVVAEGASVALVAVSLGRNDETLRWLELGYQRHEVSMGQLGFSSAFSGLRSDRRFIALLAKMGL